MYSCHELVLYIYICSLKYAYICSEHGYSHFFTIAVTVLLCTLKPRFQNVPLNACPYSGESGTLLGRNPGELT